jgi:hypothetical protein
MPEGAMPSFPYEPTPIASLDDPSIDTKLVRAVGDILQPWVTAGNDIGASAFAAKAFFVLGIIRYYVLSANAVLKQMGHLGFPSAFEVLGSAVEVIGRCVHTERAVRQDPVSGSNKRLEAGFGFVKRNHLPLGVVVETNHFIAAEGGYSAQDLIDLRNLTTHGSCIAKASFAKGDIELLHELRKAIYGIPAGETDPHRGPGPYPGAVDRYYELLATGDRDTCDRLASAGVSPVPLSLQKGTWPYNAVVIAEMKRIVGVNIAAKLAPISGMHHKQHDSFQLYG